MKEEEEGGEGEVMVTEKEEPPPAPKVTPLPYKKVFIGAMVSLSNRKTKKKKKTEEI